MFIFLFITTIFAYCDYYKNNTLIHFKDKPCTFNPEEYTFSISSLTVFNLLNTSKQLTIQMDNSNDVDVFLGIDKMKTMIERKQYYASTENLTIQSNILQDQHTLSLYSFSLEKDFELNVQTKNTTIRFSKIDNEFPLKYVINSVDGNRVVIVRSFMPPTDYILLKGNVNVVIQPANSKRRKTCETAFIGIGNITTTPFNFDLYGVHQDDTYKPIALCERNGYTRFTDCVQNEYEEYIKSEDSKEGCLCKFLWNDTKGVHYNKWDCQLYSQYLDLIAYLPNSVIEGKWNEVLVKNTNATFNNVEINTLTLNNTKSIGHINTKHLIVIGKSFTENIQTNSLELNGELYTLHLNIHETNYVLGCREGEYYKVVERTSPFAVQEQCSKIKFEL
ncbi:Hypothetical protein EHI5A_029560 [Entamoeba histolytica KU27]|uniref:Uncharacterized protein n=2 Tax=Entamoeba histolytica TaxID=5759 RepID=M2Q811_ENTHI|nr:Hypothetical protein EHI5A_029560 [Entamoeba histolytica KU27]